MSEGREIKLTQEQFNWYRKIMENTRRTFFGTSCGRSPIQSQLLEDYEGSFFYNKDRQPKLLDVRKSEDGLIVSASSEELIDPIAIAERKRGLEEARKAQNLAC